MLYHSLLPIAQKNLSVSKSAPLWTKGSAMVWVKWVLLRLWGQRNRDHKNAIEKKRYPNLANWHFRHNVDPIVQRFVLHYCMMPSVYRSIVYKYLYIYNIYIYYILPSTWSDRSPSPNILQLRGATRPNQNRTTFPGGTCRWSPPKRSPGPSFDTRETQSRRGRSQRVTSS